MADILIESFVEGKVQNKFLEINQALIVFVAEMGPTVESVHLMLKGLNATPFEKLTGKMVTAGIRKDSEGAQKSMRSYNRMFGMIDHRLAMASSNFQFRDFLELNMVPQALVQEAEEELKMYWNETYAPLVDHYSKVRDDLEELRSLLQKQIDILDTTLTKSYPEGFDTSDELRRLFSAERKLFYDKIVPLTRKKFAHEEVLKKSIDKHLVMTRNIVKAHITYVKAGVEKDLAAQKSKTRKALIVAVYLLGAYLLLRKLRSSIVKKIYGWIEKKWFENKMKTIKVQIKEIDAAVQGLIEDKGISTLETVLRVI